ncbi:hypothetical protein BGX29_004407 [Mortierella sp. GBA35]|nr:hypothetical protein BGX29_004407 [Mortierella sp. GBA35]
MEPASSRVFSRPELIEHLSTFLGSKALARLSVTRSGLDSVCSPILWRDIDFGHHWKDDREKEGLARRAHHVRSLKISSAALVLFVNAIGGTSDTLPQRQRPDWLPTPDPQSCLQDVCVSPMTQLTRLECSLDEGFISESLLSIPGIVKYDDSEKFRQVCKLIELNPGLVHSDRTHFNVEFDTYSGPWVEAVTTLFFSCPVSLESLLMKSAWVATMITELISLMEDLDSVDCSFIMRDGPLGRLRELELPILSPIQLSDYCRIMEQCPNIDTLGLVSIDEVCESIISELAPSVKEYCQRIRHIRVSDENAWLGVWNPLHILDGISSDLESLKIEGYKEGRHHVNRDNIISGILRHGQTLKDLRLIRCSILSDEIIQTILTSCAALERLEVDNRDQSAACLPELVASEWACTGLKHLAMGISWGNFDGSTPLHLPAYYLWDSDRPPSDRNDELWGLLERLYRQIGSLIELEVLDLTAHVSPLGGNPYGPINSFNPFRFMFASHRTFRYSDRFPLLLSLDAHASGRQGYLNWLSGLKNLKELRGSVHLGCPEVVMALRQKEAESGYSGYIVARPLFYDMLLKQIPSRKICFNKRVLAISEKEYKITIATNYNYVYEGDILVGVDSTYSVVRQQIYERLEAEVTLPKLDQEDHPCSCTCLVDQMNLTLKGFPN